MRFVRHLSLICILVAAIMVTTINAADTLNGNTCTSNPDDGSGLPECFTFHDNECYPGGVLYREENQDGCKSLWYWKAGWFLARFRNGTISRSNFPIEFISVLPALPPEEKADEVNVISGLCTATYDSTTGIASANFSWVPQAGQDGYLISLIGPYSFTYGYYITSPSESSNSFSLAIGTARSFTRAEFQLYTANYGTLLLDIPCTYSQT